MYAALPLLSRNQRLEQGWEQRSFRFNLPQRAELWIQAASVGETFLAWELVKKLAEVLKNRPTKILLTSNTSEGFSILSHIIQSQQHTQNFDIQVAYFPLDMPSIMRRAVARIQPRTVVLLESEIWPGFLAACKAQGTKTLLINGRMSTSSLAGYLSCPRLFQEVHPDKILAISEHDALRFSILYGHERVTTMPNIKFDRLTPRVSSSKNPLAIFFHPSTPLAVFGSIRKKEEGHILAILQKLIKTQPDIYIALCPRHLQRIDAWENTLQKNELPYTLRSKLSSEHSSKNLILWDTVGEMNTLFELAQVAFIGGTLAPLGGQNFLEPLSAGVIPIIGPHWKNFAWVGQEIIELGLVRECSTWSKVLQEMLAILHAPPLKKDVLKEFASYVKSRQGGTLQAASCIAQSLTSV